MEGENKGPTRGRTHSRPCGRPPRDGEGSRGESFLIPCGSGNVGGAVPTEKDTRVKCKCPRLGYLPLDLFYTITTVTRKSLSLTSSSTLFNA